MTCSPTLHRLFLPLVLLLAGCSQAEADRFWEGIAEIIIVAMVLTALAACVGVVLLAVQILVVVLNFVRPSGASMVTGYVFAGLHGFSIFASIGLMVSAATPVEGEVPANPDDLVSAVAGLIFTAGWTALLGGSAYYAQRRLAEAKGQATPDLADGPGLR